METLFQDMRYGFRMLFKSPGFTAVAALSLALGIGANTTIFTLINAIFLNPIPVENAPGLVTLYTIDARVKEDDAGGGNVLMPTSRPNFEDYRDHNSVFAGLVATSGLPLNLLQGGTPEQIGGEIVSGNYFSLLGVRPALGRAFLPEEDKIPGASPVVVLSHAFWTKRFGGDPGIVGGRLTLNGLPFTVVGVAPKGFLGTNLLQTPDLWVPMMMHKQVLAGFIADNFDDRRALTFNIFGRLKPDATIETAQAELRTIASNLEKEYPEPNRGRSVTLMPLAQTTIHPALRRAFIKAGGLLMTVVGLVLLIACANVANLLLARSTARRKEIAIRLSLGASRARLIRQLLTESLLLALLGGALGLLIAVWGRDLLLAFRPPQFFPNGLTLDLDGRVLGFTLAISLITGALFGIAPALQASRPDLVAELKERTGSQAAHRGGRFSLRGALVVTQVALSLISLIGAGLFLRSMQNTQRIDPGFDAKNLLTVGFDLGAQGLDMVRGRAYHDRLLETIRALPGIRSAALSANPPIGGGIGRTIFPEGQAPNTGAVGQFATTNSIGRGYFTTLGIPIRRGRDFVETDREGAPRMVIINEAMAKHFWPGQEALGKRFKFFGDESFAEVVGVAENAKVESLTEDPQPIAYLPEMQAYEPAMVLNVRTEGDPRPLLDTVRRSAQALEPSMPLNNVQTAEDLIAASLWAPRMAAILLSIFGILALVLASVGIYGVMSYAVSQRTREFGIRMALGAQPSDVLTLVLRQGMRLVGLGVAIGLAAALWTTRLAAALLVGVSATDPATFAAIALLLASVAAFASFLPARRATRIDPTIALRYE